MPNYAKTWTLGGRDEYQAGIVFAQTNINPETCTSNIYFALYLITTENDADEDYDYSVTVNGQTFSGTKEMKFGDYSYGLIVNGNVTLNHPADGGAASFNYSVSLDAEGLFFGHAYLNAADSYTFGGFSRKATMAFVSAFDDESTSIALGYNNPALTSATLNVGVSLDGTTTPVIGFKSVSSTSGLSSIALNEAEREILRKANTTGTTATATIILKCDVGGATHYDTMNKEYTIINVEPTLSPSVIEADNYVYSLTGNRNKFILGFSDAQFDTGARANKQATIDYQWIRCGSVTLDDYNQNTGTIENIDSNTFYFEMKNSRGLIANKAIALDIIPYTKLTASVETGPFTANGRVTFTLKGLYFNGSFGAQNNSMQVQYSLRDSDGNFAQVTGVRESGWVELGEIHPTTGSGTYEFSHTITGLDYTKAWELTVAVQDALTPLQTVTTVVAPLPTFDWSDSDFHHHTDVILSEGMSIYLGNVEISGDNKILWADGGWHMRARETIRLSEPISKQNNGIVLVFSLFRNNSMEDASFNSFFVSKKEVELLPNKPHTFIMGINAGFSKIGAKYIYIDDDNMTGDDTNVSSGSNNGITFDNNSFVLRYVIGV
jgi:hypothetical protein